MITFHYCLISFGYTNKKSCNRCPKCFLSFVLKKAFSRKQECFSMNHIINIRGSKRSSSGLGCSG